MATAAASAGVEERSPNLRDTDNAGAVGPGAAEASQPPKGAEKQANEASSPSQEPGRKAAKSSHFRGVTLFKPTMKWRAQISAGGKTTSLGDHDTEEEAARAFDRAAINKAGVQAKTNFSVQDYKDEIEDLQAMQQTELVAMLRSRARKSGTQSSHYRGVSLLKQTQKWHAQINVGGKQVHLGFFPTEEQAARAYDRAAINKGARDRGKIITNLDLGDYEHELDKLRRIGQHELVEALASETRRKACMEMLSSGSFAHGEDIFGSGFDARPEPAGVCSVAEIRAKAERAQPKPTDANPLFANFGKRREGADGELLPLVTRPPNFPRPVDKVYRKPGRPRTLFRRKKTPPESSDDETETDTDDNKDAEATEEPHQQPTRRSARAATRTLKNYADSEAEAETSSEAEAEAEKQPVLTTPKQAPATLEWGAASPPMRQKRRPRTRRPAAGSSSESEGEAKRDGRRRRDEPPAVVEPAEQPTWELLAYAVAAAKQTEPPPPQSQAGTSAAHLPSVDVLPRFDSVEAATAGSRATATVLDPRTPPPTLADKGSQARFIERPGLPAKSQAGGRRGLRGSPPAKEETPSVAQRRLAITDNIQQPAVARNSEELHSAAAAPQSLGERGSVAPGPNRDKASTLAGVGEPQGDKLSDAGVNFAPRDAHSPTAEAHLDAMAAFPETPDGGLPQPTTRKRSSPPRKAAKRREAPPLAEVSVAKKPKTKPAAAVPEEPSPQRGVKVLTKRQRAMVERQEQRRQAKSADPAREISPEDEPSPRSSFAANLQASPRNSVALAQTTPASTFRPLVVTPVTEGRQRAQEDAASQSSPKMHRGRGSGVGPRRLEIAISSSDDSHGPGHGSEAQQAAMPSQDGGSAPAPRRDGPNNRRKRKQPVRAAV